MYLHNTWRWDALCINVWVHLKRWRAEWIFFRSSLMFWWGEGEMRGGKTWKRTDMNKLSRMRCFGRTSKNFLWNINQARSWAVPFNRAILWLCYLPLSHWIHCHNVINLLWYNPGHSLDLLWKYLTNGDILVSDSFQFFSDGCCKGAELS